jgi:hypothetical protein
VYYMKVDTPYARACFNWTTMVEWGFKNGYQKDVPLKEVESRV